MDIHYHSWEHHSPPFSTTGNRIGNADQPSAPPVTQRSARTSSDIPPRTGPLPHPFLVGHSSSARAGSSATSSMIPTLPRQQCTGTRRSSSHRGLSQVGTVASPSDQTGFYFIPSGASSRNFQEAENHPPTRFRSWQRDHLPPFSVNQADRDSGRSTFHQGGGGGSDASIRSGSFRQRHGSERMSSQNR
ncbi:hypothetical protein OIU78_021298 [Salix suchowensis]|nr:hypothetical protein OIU78_021298 [Salix suchowensis]